MQHSVMNCNSNAINVVHTYLFWLFLLCIRRKVSGIHGNDRDCCVPPRPYSAGQYLQARQEKVHFTWQGVVRQL